jgi:uncharacterized protein (DUF983 family)
MTGPYYPPLPPIATGIRCRCPRCGHGRLFDGYLTVREACDTCGLEICAHDTGDGPAVFIILILGAIVVPLVLWFETVFTPPLWVHTVLWGMVILGSTIALIRPLMGAMVALQFRHQTPNQ